MTIKQIIDKINEALTVRNKTARHVLRLAVVIPLVVGLGSMLRGNYAVATASYLISSVLLMLLVDSYA